MANLPIAFLFFYSYYCFSKASHAHSIIEIMIILVGWRANDVHQALFENFLAPVNKTKKRLLCCCCSQVNG
jgi:hypothetical protein